MTKEAESEVERLRNLAANALQCVRAGQLEMAEAWLCQALWPLDRPKSPRSAAGGISA